MSTTMLCVCVGGVAEQGTRRIQIIHFGIAYSPTLASSSIPPLNCHELTSSDPNASRDYLRALRILSLSYLLILLRESCTDGIGLLSHYVSFKIEIKKQRFQ